MDAQTQTSEVALVTGATSGIGRAVAPKLASAGLEVIVHGRDADRGPTADLDVSTFDALFASNVRAAHQLVAAIAPRMAARGHGSIVSLGSMAGHVGLVGGAAYGATKAALSALSRAWAAEFSPAGVRVNTVAAGPVYTDGAGPERIEQLGKTTLMRRAGRGDRRGHRLRRVRQGELHHWRGDPRRRRPHRHLKEERTPTEQHLLRPTPRLDVRSLTN